MVLCNVCKKDFKSNAGLTRHTNRKNPCKPPSVEPLVEPPVEPSVEHSVELKVQHTFEQCDGLEYLQGIAPESIGLVLTDPPYIISKESGMNTHYNKVKSGDNSITKTQEQWEEYKEKHNITDETKRENFLKYGTIYGTKYCVKTDYGDWDKEFTIEKLQEYIKEFYKKLKKGGTLIIFFDLWKIETLKKLLEKNKFCIGKV